MSNAVVRWTVPTGTLVVLGPVAAWLTSMMAGPDGSSATPALLSSSPLMGLVLVLAAIGVAGVAGVIASRLMGHGGAGWGLFCAGMVLAWAAWPTGTVEDVLRRTQSGASLWTLAVEGLIVGAAATGMAWVVIRAHPQPVAAPTTSSGRRVEPPGMDVFATGLAAVIVGAGVGVWLAAQESLKGQAIGAAFIGGLLGAIAARLSAERCPTWVLVAGLGVLAAVSPALGAILHGSGGDGAVRAAYNGTLFNLAKVMPLDWLAGGFMGIPIGLSWAGGMIEERVPQAAVAKAG
jgi:hypothetical protein